jgi:hypothetical protein
MRFSTLFIAATLIAAQAAATDFNGVELGSYAATADLPSKLGTARMNGPYVAGRYSGSMKIGDCPAMTHVTVDAAGAVQQIEASFDPSCFDALASSAMAKFGKPSTSGDYTLTNGFGRSILVHEHDWRPADGSLAVLVNYDAIQSENLHVVLGSITLKSAKVVADEKAKRDAGPKGSI